MYSAADEASFHATQRMLAERFAQLEQALGDGPYFAGQSFSLVDAAYAPVFRYFDVFDEVDEINFFNTTPKVRNWRNALARRPSIRAAVAADYAAMLRQFVIGRGGVLGQRLASRSGQIAPC